MKRALKWIAIRLVLLMTVLVVTIGAIAYWIIVYPADAWRFVQKHSSLSDMQVTWGEYHFKPEKISWTHWNIEWQVKDLRIIKGSPKLDVPIDEAAMIFSFSVWKPATRADFAKVVLHASQPMVIESTGESKPAPEQSWYQMMRSYLGYLDTGGNYATMNELDVDIKDLRVAGMRIAARVGKAGDGKSPVAFDSTVKGANLDLALTGVFDATRLKSADPFMTAHVDFKGSGATAVVDLKAAYDRDALTGTVSGPVSVRGYRLSPKLDFTLNELALDLRARTSVAGLPGPLLKLDAVDAKLTIPMQNGATWADAPSAFAVEGPVELFFVSKNMRPPLDQACACKIPERVKIAVNGRAWFKTLLAADTPFRKPALEARATVEGVKNKLFGFDLAANVKLGKDGTAWVFEPELDSEAHLYSYQGLRKFLDGQNVLIPAPLDVLDGTVDVVARGPLVRTNDSTKTVVKTKIALASENQKVNVETDVTLELMTDLSALNVTVSSRIDDLQLQLPPLDPIAGMPKVTRDKRVEIVPEKDSGTPKKPSKFQLRVFVEAKTNRPGAIRLLSKYTQPNVPISVNVQRSMQGDLLGQVQLESFDIKYLRRTVHVEQFRLLLDNNENGSFPVDGRMRVDQTAYRIFIDVSGTSASPSIRLSSDPYLPRNEIISVLLYDRTSEQLVSGDAETAGSFEAAMADRAIGLFGLWAFASTPIKSFSYNPITKVYTATVQLADGLTAGIGTNWEEATQFEIRKRVSRRWVLTASWSPSETDGSQVGKLVLQWEKRF